MKHETPKDSAGAKLCAWCGEVVRQAGVGRSRDYCKRSCRQRAYEARKQREAVVAAVAAAVARTASDSSRDEKQKPSNPSRDEMKPQVTPPIPASEPTALPSAWRVPAAPRRPLARRRSSMSASPMPLWQEPEVQGQPDARPPTDGS